MENRVCRGEEKLMWKPNGIKWGLARTAPRSVVVDVPQLTNIYVYIGTYI